MRGMITQEEVKEAFDYDPYHPLALRWRRKAAKARIEIGAIAGYWHAIRAGSQTMQRYVDVGHRRRVPVHHVVWVYHNGTSPSKCFGPKPDNPHDYRIENLVKNPRRKPLEELKSRRSKYWRKWRDGFTDEQWSARLREQDLRLAYGIMPETYQKLFDAQGGVCAICRHAETMVRRGKVEVLAIDHCHNGGGIRGLLCHNCNAGLGRFGDDPERLRAAAAYLERHASSPPSSVEGR